jgi:hypothetical protein
VNKRTKFLLGIAAVATLVIGFQVVAFANLTGSPFQGGDGNLVDDGVGIDWNSFDPIQWTGTAPNRLASENPTDKTDPLADGWQIVGKEDGEKNADTSGFAGGTKQDNNCPSVINTSSPNKDDLKRAYLSTKVIGGDTFLNLAWVRTKQNNTSASAHVGFEFNQGTVACASGGLVNRVEDDLLVVYDFEGSAQDPVISLRTWLPSGSAEACEVGSNSPPCWSEKTDLSAFSEAKVNGPLTGIGPVVDALSPPGPPATGPGPSDDETLGVSEFGEASINLSDALPDVFGPGACNTFGKAEVISRSSGNSEQAAMMDLVGPVPFTLSNCGSVTIIKQTDPRGLNQAFSFTSTLAGTELTCTADTTPASFTLNDTGNAGKTLGSILPAQNSAGNTEACTNVPAGTYTVTEGADPSGFSFGSVTCTNSGGNTTSTAGKVATINVVGSGSTTCVYINVQNKQTILNTAQSFFPNDTATITGTGITGTGTVNFQLRKGTLDPATETCANTTDPIAYQQTVTPTGTPKTATTTNGDGVAPEFSLVAADAGSYYWRVSYSDGAGGDPDVQSCNEVNTVTINNGAEVKEPPTI